MNAFCCKKCGSLSLYTELQGNNTGLYCCDCGTWIKWLNKSEIRIFNYHNSQSTVNAPAPAPTNEDTTPKIQYNGKDYTVAQICNRLSVAEELLKAIADNSEAVKKFLEE